MEINESYAEPEQVATTSRRERLSRSAPGMGRPSAFEWSAATNPKGLTYPRNNAHDPNNEVLDGYLVFARISGGNRVANPHQRPHSFCLTVFTDQETKRLTTMLFLSISASLIFLLTLYTSAVGGIVLPRSDWNASSVSVPPMISSSGAPNIMSSATGTTADSITPATPSTTVRH